MSLESNGIELRGMCAYPGRYTGIFMCTCLNSRCVYLSVTGLCCCAPPPPQSSVVVFLCQTLSATICYSGCRVLQGLGERSGWDVWLFVATSLHIQGVNSLLPPPLLRRCGAGSFQGCRGRLGAGRSVAGKSSGAASTQQGLFVSHLVTVVSGPPATCQS